MLKTIPQVLAVMTLASHVIFAAFFVLFALDRAKVVKNGIKRLRRTIEPYSYMLLFGGTLLATLGSLFFSEILHFPPCELCWFQRIMMYPQPIMLYIATLRNERVLTPYLLVINIIGIAISTYHYAIQRFPALTITNCSVKGGVSCIKGYEFYFGYISIPLMAFTVFLFNIIILSLFTRKD